MPSEREAPRDILVNRPDYVVFVPRQPRDPKLRDPKKPGDTYNDYFQVIEDEKRGLLYAFWTQASREGAIDQHIAFSKSADRGRTWSAPKLLCDRDGGKPFLHPRSPVPFYDWKGPEAGSGTYFALIHNALGRPPISAVGRCISLRGLSCRPPNSPSGSRSQSSSRRAKTATPSTRVLSCWTARACCGAMTRSSISAAASSAPNGLTD